MKHLKAITHAHVWVLDHQQALDFYVGKLGMEVKADHTNGGYRWLTVGVPGEDVPEIVLEVPGPPAVEAKTAAQIRDLVTKGAMGIAMALRTDDCRALHQALVAKGVEFTQDPTDHGYGIDCGLRDPFGNQIRILQPKGKKA
jgi:catechol 2,3-dioxygenase-like lactoylglutathione lyase family enzyme